MFTTKCAVQKIVSGADVFKSVTVPQQATPASAATQLRLLQDLSTGQIFALDADGNLIPLQDLAGKGISVTVKF